MENIKQQIEECKKAIAEINQARDKTIKYFENKISELEQQVNKPKIEVGDWVELNYSNESTKKTIKRITKISGNEFYYYGTESQSNEWFSESQNNWFKYPNPQIKEVRKLSNEEVTEALTNYFGKLYSGVEKVDRRGLIESMGYSKDIDKLVDGRNTRFTDYGFMYKGRYVMDMHGNIAKPVISNERYNMCKDQNAQIDCRNADCYFQDKGYCSNVSPAITLNENKSFVCWSKKSKINS